MKRAEVVAKIVGAWLLLAAAAGFVGYKVVSDPWARQQIAPSIAPAPRLTQSPTNTPVSRTNTGAPVYATSYAQAFCDANVATIATTTSIDGLTEADIAAYFASDATACSGVRYLGAVNDGGAERHIFVLTYAEGREDYIILTFDAAHMATGLKRG